ncbi:translation elongation factor Ts [Candidatus Gracilibacteria bacterium]|nr:translation elongation factor Ts [Candidatus Gracilibacteria bacterium]
MAITAALIKELRERTGIGMMECKKALEATDGDIEQAIEELRKKGLAKAAKKADREALEGGLKILIDGTNAYVVSVSCETDFLANSEKFKLMLEVIALHLKNNGVASKSEAQTLLESNYSMEMGENLQVKDYEIIEGGTVSSYVHSNAKLAAVVVAEAGGDEEKLKQVAMHVTAANPEYLSESEISDDIIEKEKAIQLEMMKNDPNMGNKPDEVLLKIIEGKMGKFKSEVSLLEQAFVIDPSVKVKDFLGSTELTSFKRYAI